MGARSRAETIPCAEHRPCQRASGFGRTGSPADRAKLAFGTQALLVARCLTEQDGFGKVANHSQLHARDRRPLLLYKRDLEKHLPSLDGLRGVAVLAVLAFHVTVWFRRGSQSQLESSLQNAAMFGRYGVDLFFVLSGFLITQILLASRGMPGYFRVFYARRALRIFPLYYVYLVAVALGCAFSPSAWAVFSRAWPWYALYLTNVQFVFFGQATVEATRHLWSLAVEEQFYLVWPVVVAWLPRRSLLPSTCVLIAAVVVGRYLWGQQAPGPYAVYMSTWTRADALLIGAVLALVRKNERAWSRLVRAAPYLTALAWLCWLPSLFQWFDRFEAHYSMVALQSAGLLVLCVAADERGGGVPLLRAAVLQRVGAISYGIYVFHYALAVNEDALVSRVLGPQRTTWSASLVLVGATAYAAASLSYRYLETPWLRLKRYVPGIRRADAAARAPEAPFSHSTSRSP